MQAGHSTSRSVRAARLSTQRLDALLGDQSNHGKAGERIGPPPSEPRIERQPNEQDCREVCTDRRLTCFGLERAAVELRGDASLETDQDRHDDERQRGDDDPDAAGGGRLTAYERLGGVDCDIERERHEAHTDDTERPPLNALASGFILVTRQPPTAARLLAT